MERISRLIVNRSRFYRFLFLQALDLETTLIGFSVGCVEANPAIAHFFPALGPLVGLLVGKLLTVSVILGYMMNSEKANTEKGWKFVNGLFTLLIVWNTAIIAFSVLSK